jgi:putative FmdB family regulatory protein
MPLFEYICKSCGEVFEQLVTAARKPVCPHCGSRKLKKQLSSFSAPAAQSFAPPPCGSGTCPARGMGCAGGGCPHSA